MRPFFFFFILNIFCFSSAQAEVSWNGSTSWRHLFRERDDGLASRDAAGKDQSKQMTKRWEIRAALGAGEKGEVVDWGVGFRTQSSAGSEWLTVRNSLDLAIGLELGFVRFRSNWWESEWAAKVGRQTAVVYYDTLGQALFDKDVRWDGFGWTWKKGNFGLNLSQYVLGAFSGSAVTNSSFSETDAEKADANTQRHFGILYSFQPHFKFQVTEQVQALFAVGYHLWSGTGGNQSVGWYENQIHGGVRFPTAGAAGDNVDGVILDNSRQWQFFTEWTLPMSFRFIGEYLLNKEVSYGKRFVPTTVKADRDSLALSLVYGKAKLARDWSLSYSFVDKGIAASVNTFSNSNMPADNIGHLVDARYLLADGLAVGAKGEFYREKAQLDGAGQRLTAPNQNRKQVEDRYELWAGLSF